MKNILLLLAFIGLAYHLINGSGPRGDAQILAHHDEVVLYSTSWCGYCKKARNLLNEKNIAFIEYDIEKSAEGKRLYDALNGRGVPVLQVKGTVIYGYDKRGILAAAK